MYCMKLTSAGNERYEMYNSTVQLFIRLLCVLLRLLVEIFMDLSLFPEGRSSKRGVRNDVAFLPLGPGGVEEQQSVLTRMQAVPSCSRQRIPCCCFWYSTVRCYDLAICSRWDWRAFIVTRGNTEDSEMWLFEASSDPKIEYKYSEIWYCIYKWWIIKMEILCCTQKVPECNSLVACG